MSVKVTDVASGILALCAIVLTGVVVRREMRSPTRVVSRSVRAVPNAAQLALAGQVIGSDSAELTVVEFSDFQCPYCAEQAKYLAQFRASSGGRIRVVYRHLPLVGLHPFAWQAALAAECAASQGRFKQYHDRLFSLHDSIGSVSWQSVAATAGVPDTARFRSCVERQEFADVIERDLAVAQGLELRGTPSLIIGDTLYEGIVTPDVLERLIRDSVKRKRHR